MFDGSEKIYIKVSSKFERWHVLRKEYSFHLITEWKDKYDGFFSDLIDDMVGILNKLYDYF